MYRVWIKRLENVLLLGSLLTAAAGFALFFWPAAPQALLGLALAPSSLFPRGCGLLIFLLGVAYSMAVINHEKNMGIFWLAGFEKVLFSGLLAAFIVIDHLHWLGWTVVALDLTLGALFFAYLKYYREDNWL